MKIIPTPSKLSAEVQVKPKKSQYTHGEIFSQTIQYLFFAPLPQDNPIPSLTVYFSVMSKRTKFLGVPSRSLEVQGLQEASSLSGGEGQCLYPVNAAQNRALLQCLLHKVWSGRKNNTV